MQNLINIKNYSSEELKQEALRMGLPAFRGEQIFTALYGQRISKFEEITTLPKELKAELEKKYLLNSLSAEDIKKSTDGTIKFLFSLAKGSSIESVLIPEFDEDEEGKLIRNTLCVSSQVGCAMDCAFCATGKLRFGRNLEPAEIIDQVLLVEKITGEKVTNIVFMGMGEPLHNYDNVMKAIGLMTNAKEPVLSRKKITISTSGIVAGIKRMTNEPKPIKLALSLHATTNGVREKLMPVAKKWKIPELRAVMEDYYKKTKIPVTYEYIMFDGLNDTPADAKRLARFVRGVPSKINIIPYHDISFTSPQGFAKGLKASPKERIVEFAGELRSLGVNVFIRNSSGFDIDAACGQLAYSRRSL